MVACMTARIPDCHPDRKHRAKGLCGSCYSMKWQKEHPEADSGTNWLRNRPEILKEKNRKYHLAHKHRTSVELYTAMWHQQNGKCANQRCQAFYPLVVEDYRKGLHVDHDHAT